MIKAATSVTFAFAPLQQEHYLEVKQIYEQGIKTGIATLQTTASDWNSWDKSHIQTGRIVAVRDKSVLGWAALTPVSGSCVYSGVAEVSVYFHPNHQGQGIGKALLNQVILDSEKSGFWTLQASIMRENSASVILHEKCGFRIVGLREKIGQLHGSWRDIYLLERRSKVVEI